MLRDAHPRKAAALDGTTDIDDDLIDRDHRQRIRTTTTKSRLRWCARPAARGSELGCRRHPVWLASVCGNWDQVWRADQWSYAGVAARSGQ